MLFGVYKFHTLKYLKLYTHMGTLVVLLVLLFVSVMGEAFKEVPGDIR